MHGSKGALPTWAEGQGMTQNDGLVGESMILFCYRLPFFHLNTIIGVSTFFLPQSPFSRARDAAIDFMNSGG